MSPALSTADLPVRTSALPDQLFTGSSAPSADRMAAIVNAGWTKPNGGMWTSTRTGPGNSEWVAFCEREYPDGLAVATCRVTLHVCPDARIAEIDNAADLAELLVAYPAHGLDGQLRLDFEAMAVDFDGLHLTDNGESETRSGYSGHSLYSWDFESTLWFRWAFVGPGTTAIAP